VFLSGNVMEGDEKVTQDNWRGTAFYFERKRLSAAVPFPAPAIENDTAADAYKRVLAKAGATLPRRDAIDDRIIREVTDGSGHIIKSVGEVSGSPNFK